jgi:tetratricopeptide (TPR) repeat protein
LAIALLKPDDGLRTARQLTPFLVVAIAALTTNFSYYPTPLNERSEFAIGSHAIANYFHMLFRLLAGAHFDVWLPKIGTETQIGLGAIMAATLLVVACKRAPLRGGTAWTLAALAPFALWPDGANIWRYYYLASAGSCFLQAAFLTAIAERIARVAPRIRHLSETAFIVCALALSAVSMAATDARQAVQYGFSGLYFAKSKRYEQALSQYEKALALDPDNALAMNWRYHLAICQFKSGRTLIAYANMIDIIPVLSDRDDIYAWLIQAHAVLYQMRGIELGENDSFTLYKEGHNAFRSDILRAFAEGNFRKSRSLALAYLHYFPDDGELAHILAQSQTALRPASNEF